ncbi:uncharacterized protein [Linepithema humile]|uniref:uncharacterized protein n=1 Tax=Linepithema humile TaxID=83485 RepID=UPI00351E2DA5
MMNDSRNSKSDETIIDVKRRFLSECAIPDVRILKKICSVPELDSNTSYDDICGPWKFDNVPLHDQYSYQPFTLITSEDVAYMRQQRDEKLILLFLEKKILRNTSYKDEKKEILVKLLWQTFKFFKEKLFTDQQICTVIELILSTHNFYLANYWNTIEETYNYFFKRVLQCTVMDPPKCVEIFTPNQAEIILEFFHEIYLQNIVLLHLVYMTHYCIVMRFGDRQ